MSNFKEAQATLEKRYAELTTRMDDIDDQLGAPGDDDSEEMATESAGDETLESIGHASEQEVNQIAEALDRIKSGTYGKCVGCGEAIAPARLEAVPHAARCIKCAQA